MRRLATRPLRFSPVFAVFAGCWLLLGTAPLRADGPADNIPDRVRPVPPRGLELTAAQRQAVESAIARIDQAAEPLRAATSPAGKDRLIDALVVRKALQDALKYQEFFAPADLGRVENATRWAVNRAGAADNGSPPGTGLVVHAYTSKIDGSIQPYGLVVPDAYRPDGDGLSRLDVWFHGRGETLSELNFIDQRLRQKGEFTPPNTFVLHPYGRYCNANKLAGEVDLLEALDDVRRRYRIDPDRISVRGFSMGGAACWQFAVHYPDRWFAANPGAGFAETPRFLNVFQRETLQPTWFEKKLWHLYDCTDVAANLRQCPTVAYSGEIDNQKQAADVMAEALEAENITLTHIIGPQTKHAYHPDAKREVERRMSSLAERGRERNPRVVTLVTYTLKYNRSNWVTIDALGAHWTEARVDAALNGASSVTVKTRNVNALTLDFPAGGAPFPITDPVTVRIDDREVAGPRPETDRSWRCRLVKVDGAWRLVDPNPIPNPNPTSASGLVKRHDLQGPIDDAFMDAFVFVMPSGKSAQPAVEAWVESESRRAIARWRTQFRGEPRDKKDTEVTDADIAGMNLVLWGDPSSNAVLKRIADRLPIRYAADSIQVGARRYDAAEHVPILIHPNPLNPSRYVVLNSGFTYREYDDLNNARQVPKLPDWAIINLKTPPNSRTPGAIVDAGFFGEKWDLTPHHDPGNE